jgi:D-alanyl-D-alanine dipeptidase
MVGRTLPGGIRILELLGDTPVGPHYRAEDPTGIEVAVLILGSSAELALPRSSLQPAIQIKHPNVIAIHDLNETDDGLVYAVAERLTGEFLSATLARRGALPLWEARDLCLQAAAGLQAAHDLGWVHGSLSPSTILLAQTVGGRPLVKLIGFAHEFPLRQSKAESTIDGRVYASPERIAGHLPDERSDVFSLGAMLHHLLTGAAPTPGSRSGDVPETIRDVLNRALAPSPARRFQTIAEFTAALAPTQEELFPILWPAEPERPAWAWRRALAFGAAAVLVGVLAGLWLPWGTQRPSGGASARARSQESGSIAAVQPDSFSALARLSADSEAVAVRRNHSAAQIPTDSVLRTPTGRTSDDSAPAVAESLLVDVQSVDSTIQVDLRYATANNFTGAPLPGYEAQRALLLPEVATALGRVQARLRREGVGLRIFDAYRPVRATRAMANWAERTGRRELFESGFIGQRSQHNLGVAVDVTLVDLETGTEVPNPDILSRTMKSEGFSTLDQASYHFVYELEGAMPLDRVIR